MGKTRRTTRIRRSHPIDALYNVKSWTNARAAVLTHPASLKSEASSLWHIATVILLTPRYAIGETVILLTPPLLAC